ncbi:MAG: glycosyltransferase family 1 protein, partial [Bacteroidales bacterium]|nr:glycosyltransferase family 1 protein [Bacteroidales bacterium]
EQQKDGANPKVFEICAAGAYQVCDANPYIRQLFPDGEIGLYETPEQMISCLGKALNGDMAQDAAAARKKVLAGHTFDARIAQVIQDINR